MSMQIYCTYLATICGKLFSVQIILIMAKYRNKQNRIIQIHINICIPIYLYGNPNTKRNLFVTHQKSFLQEWLLLAVFF